MGVLRKDSGYAEDRDLFRRSSLLRGVSGGADSR